MTNLQRLTSLSFLAYFVMSGMLAPIGIISAPMAELFNEDITTVTARFSWLTIGNMLGALLALAIFDFLELKKVMVAVYLCIVASLLTLGGIGSAATIGLPLGIVGVGCGLGLAGAALIISRSYADNRRASMLVITDGFFSIAGFVCAAVATWFVSRQFHWAAVYQFVAAVALIILLLAATSTMPRTTDQPADSSQTDRWPVAVWYCLGALFLYTLGQYSMLWWLPNYVTTVLGAAPELGGKLVGLFWIGMFVAQIFVAWWVVKVGTRRLIVIAGIATSAFSVPLWSVESVAALPILALLWGIANLSMLKVVLSFATQMLRVPSARLVSALLLAATLGTAISPSLTSRIVADTDNLTILQFSTACYVTLTILLIAATRSFSQPISTP